MPKRNELHAVVIRDSGRHVAIDSGTACLPVFNVTQASDLVHQAAVHFEIRYGVGICVLFSFQSSEFETNPDHHDLTLTPIVGSETAVLVAQPWNDNDSLPPSLIWAPVSAVHGDGRTTQILIEALQQLWDRKIGRVKACLGNDNWFRELTAFNLHPEERNGVRLQHWTGGGTSALIRMDTVSRSLWLKAAARNRQETSMRLIRFLSDSAVPYVPHALGYLCSTNGLWDGMAQEHISGPTLRQSNRLDGWIETARRMAEIQISAIESAPSLRLCGCEEWSWSRLDRESQRLMRWIGAKILSEHDLLGVNGDREILPQVSKRVQTVLAGCAQLESSLSLARLRFSPDNVILHPSLGPFFVTWTAAVLAPPFVWWDAFSRSFLESNDGNAGSQVELQAAYLGPWFQLYDERAVQQMMESSPIVSGLVNALRLAFKEEMLLPGLDEYLPAEREEWAWELSRDEVRLDAMRACLRTLTRALMAQEVHA